MDTRVRDLLAMMAARRTEEAAEKSRREDERLKGQFAARGVLNSGFAHVGLADNVINAHAEAKAGLLADYMSVAADVHADDHALGEFEASYRESVTQLGQGLKRRFADDRAQDTAVLSPQIEEKIDGAVNRLIRDAKIVFERERMRRSSATNATKAQTIPTTSEVRDFFLSHAGEDKEAFASPLAQELVGRGYTVWFSAYEITLGDSLRARIDRGLSESRFGIVVLSAAFFLKPWPQNELDALAARAAQEGRKVILPVRHGLTLEQLARHSPTLAGVISVDSAIGVSAVADAIVKASEAESRRQGADGVMTRGAKKDATAVPRPSMKWGSYQFDGDDRLYCIKCYETGGRKHPTVRLNIHQRQCAVCQTVVSSD
jgi:hypothetical protein